MSATMSKLQIFSKDLKEEKDFWVRKLSGELNATGLRPDFARPVVCRPETETCDIPVSQGTLDRLTKIAGDSPLLTYTVLLAALNVCLQKYTASATVIVGSPARVKEGATTTQANALAIVVEPDGGATFRQLLMATRERLIEAYGKQNYPFNRLLSDLNLELFEDRCPLFDVTLSLKGLHTALPELRNDISIAFERDADGLRGRLEYRSHLFRRETIESFVRHYLNVMEAAVADVNVLISDIDMLDDAERRRLLYEWNDTSVEHRRERLLHNLFEEQCERTPEAVAVRMNGERLSYRELNERANRLAHYLRSRGIAAESRVGIFVERSIEMVVGLLGVLKAGGIYVPLDSSYPQERLTLMLEDSGVELILMQSRLAGALPSGAPPALCLDSEWASMAALPADNIPSVITSGNAAYLIYTSGSTGRPKGVVVAHGGVCNMVEAQTRAFNIDSGSRVLQFASFSFDASVSEIFMALATGATLYLASKEILADAHALARLMREERITAITLPPAMLSVMSGENLPDLRTLITAGDSCSYETASRWMEGRDFFNAYGPTEASVCATIEKCSNAHAAIPPIGRPIANTRVYVLDEQMQVVPVGVAGELYIAGDGLARGYLHRAELTAEKFVPDPFSLRGGERLYRTGDVVRYLSDGRIEFIGRVDHQVKVRGYRIELGEVEAALMEAGQVRDVVVVVREDVVGDKRLVAYVVADGELSAAQMREQLRERLPEYMVPSAIVKLEELPLTQNGKVDRRALPVPEAERSGEAEYVGPRTEVEELVAGVWCEVLGVERVSVEENFFELGGHSLLATQVISRVRESFNVEVTLEDFFTTPTVEGLSELIGGADGKRGETGAQSIVPVPRTDQMPLSFTQQRLWFIDQLEPGSPFYNIPSAVRLQGRLNRAALEESLNEIVRRHETLRTTFASVNGQPTQVIAPTLKLEMPLVDLEHVPQSEREAEALRLAVEETLRPFDLSRGPLLRVTLLRLGEEEHIVLLTLHHIVSDGWSMGVLIREVAACYEAFSTSKPAMLPPLPVQYADFAVWQRNYLQGETLEELLSYWRQQLADLPMLSLPTDRPRPEIQTQRGAYQAVVLPASLSESVHALSRQEGATPFMTLLAAFHVLLYHYTGQQDIVVGTDVANRNRIETEGLIGFFINHLVLRTKLAERMTFRELVGGVRQTSLAAYAHQDMPFDMLVKALKPKRDLSHTPLFQVLFVVQNAPMPALELPGLRLSMVEADNGTTKFDLALFIVENETQLRATWKYNPDLFDAATITRMAQLFETLLAQLVAAPDNAIDSFVEQIKKTEREQETMNRQERQQAKVKMLGSIKRKSLDLTGAALVETRPLNPDQPMPLLIRRTNPDLAPLSWAATNRDLVKNLLRQHGAILFRDFPLSGVADFERLAGALCPTLFGEYGDLPREGVASKVYGATPYPNDQPILYHNESSHLSRWPMKIFFHCIQPPESGGETPIVDCRKVYQLLDEDVRERMEQKGLMYVRNFAPGLDVSWQDFYRTNDRAEVERRCRETGTEFEWIGEDGLRTRERRAAITLHPLTGEKIFFNQVQLHHGSSLAEEVRRSLLDLFGEDGLPRNVVYGDGEPISDEDMHAVGRAYERAEVTFPWQRGDLLMVDNMLVAHGRKAYRGERKIVVAMGEIITAEEAQRQAAETVVSDIQMPLGDTLSKAAADRV